MTEFFPAIPTAESATGIALEVTRGTPVAPNLWLPTLAPKYKPDLQYLNDEGMRGSMVTSYDMIPGLRFDSFGWDMYPYLDTFPALLRACLGSKDTKTAASGATTLVVEAVEGAEEVEVTSATGIVEGKTYLVIGTASTTSDTRLVTKVTGKKLKLAYPLEFAHAAAATVVGLTTHEFSLLNNSYATGNQPPSYTITDYSGETNWRQLAAGQLDTLSISGAADSLPKLAVQWMANKAIVPSTPTASYTTIEAPPGWTVQCSINGTQIGYLVSWAIDLKRNVKNIPAITGNENYYQHFAGALGATAKLVVLENTASTILTYFEEATQVAFDLTLSDVKSGFATNFHTTASKFVTGEIDRSKEYVEVPLELAMIPSATDALAGGVSPIKATVANGTTTEY